MIFFMKSKFGKFYRLEYCTDFFSYSSQTSSWYQTQLLANTCLADLTVLLMSGPYQGLIVALGGSASQLIVAF